MNNHNQRRCFHDRVVMITGAAGNLGQAVARAFVLHGARVVLVDRTAERLEKTYRERDEDWILAPINLFDGKEVEQVVRDVLRRTERIDVLCNLAGGFSMGQRVHETSDADLDVLLDVNVRSVLNVVRAVVPLMLQAKTGKIVNVGALSALRGNALMGSYCISKDAVIRLTESMSAELKEQGINVNCVLPSIIDTPENRASMPDADATRWVDAGALADIVVFLASDSARALHGAAIPVSGLV